MNERERLLLDENNRLRLCLMKCEPLVRFCNNKTVLTQLRYLVAVKVKNYPPFVRR
jgi:hypothetical protein